MHYPEVVLGWQKYKQAKNVVRAYLGQLTKMNTYRRLDNCFCINVKFPSFSVIT